MGSQVALQLLLAVASSQSTQGTSGGPLRPDQAAYDVKTYDISIKADPARKTLSGMTLMEAKTLTARADIWIDLHDNFTVSKVTDGKAPLRFERGPGGLR